MGAEAIDAAKRAFDGVVNSLEWQGEDIQIGHVCIGTGVGSYQFYCDRPCVTNDLHGVGAFLLMCTELQVAENVCAQNRGDVPKCKGNTAQFPPDGLSTAPAAAARHLRCQNAR